MTHLRSYHKYLDMVLHERVTAKNLLTTQSTISSNSKPCTYCPSAVHLGRPALGPTIMHVKLHTCAMVTHLGMVIPTYKYMATASHIQIHNYGVRYIFIYI